MKKIKKFQSVIAIMLLFFIITPGVANAMNDSSAALKKNQKNRDLIIKVQAENKLNVTGTLNAQTKKAMNKQLIVRNDKLPKSVANDKVFITVNKDKRILTVFNKGKTVGRYPVAVGRTGRSTPSYRWTIREKIVNRPYYTSGIPGGAPNNPLGKRWLGLKGIGSGYGIHGNASPNSIGKYISAGCIRMINSDIERIYPSIPVGTKVWTGTEKELARWGIGFNKGDYYVGSKKPSTVKVSGKMMNVNVDNNRSKVQAYNYKNYNYIKLRDIAALLNKTDSNFNVSYNNKNKIITMTKQPYKFIGGELNNSNKFKKEAYPSSAKINYENKMYNLKSYTVDGFNYVKLRDVLSIINIPVEYNNDDGEIVIAANNNFDIGDSVLTKLNVDGKDHKIESYMFKGNNYVKLRDVAEIYKDASVPFNVVWDKNSDDIRIIQEMYQSMGGENSMITHKNNLARKHNPTIEVGSVNSKIVSVEAYNIKNHNYIKLRDIASLVNSDVEYVHSTRTVYLTSNMFDEKDVVDNKDNIEKSNENDVEEPKENNSEKLNDSNIVEPDEEDVDQLEIETNLKDNISDDDEHTNESNVDEDTDLNDELD